MPALLLLASALWLSQAPPAAPAPVKDSTEIALDAAGLTYTKLPGFYQLPFTLAESRRQTVYVRRAAEAYKSVGINEAFAICYESESEPTAEMLQKTFLRRFTIGGLVLEAPSETQPKWRIRYRLEITTKEPPARLKQMLSIVASTSDTLEKELGGSAAGDKL